MSNPFEDAYIALINEVIDEGQIRPTRAGRAYSMFAKQLEVEHCPLLWGRKVNWKAVAGELAAFLKGCKNVEDFKSRGCNYWDSWADELGKLKLDYGTAWIDFNGVNQLVELIQGLKNDPFGRRHIITGWRPETAKLVALPCCHLLYQWYVDEDKKLHMIWYQRSADLMVGIPSDAFTAYLLNRLVAQSCGLTPGKITMMLGDVHIYENHLAGMIQYLRNTKHGVSTRVYGDKLILDSKANVFNFEPDMLDITEYNCHATIKFKLNV